MRSQPGRLLAASTALLFVGHWLGGAEKVASETLVEGFEGTVAMSLNRVTCDASFEGPTAFQSWTVSRRSLATPSREHATQGRQSMHFVIPRRDEKVDTGELHWPRVTLKFKDPRDWSAFDAILVDVYNPLDDVNFLRGEVVDTDGRSASFQMDMQARSLRTGMGRFEDLRQKVDLSRVVRLVYYIQHDGNPHPYFLDNVRLATLEQTMTRRAVSRPPPPMPPRISGSCIVMAACGSTSIRCRPGCSTTCPATCGPAA